MGYGVLKRTLGKNEAEKGMIGSKEKKASVGK